MKFVRTFISLLILALLAGYIYYAKKKEEKKAEIEEKSKIVLSDFEPDDLQKLIFKNKNIEITFRKLDKKDKDGRLLFWIDEPISAKPDKFTVRNLVSAVKRLKIKRDLGKVKDVSEYGLNPAELEITVIYGKDKDHPVKKTLTFGHTTPGGDGMYASIGDGKLYVVDNDLDYQKDRTLYNFREKQAFDLTAGDVEEVKLSFPSDPKKKTLVFKKRDGKWYIERPYESPADDAEVGSWVSGWSIIRADEFVSEDPKKEAARYGLDRPAAELSLRAEGEEKPQVLIVGRILEEKDKSGKKSKKLYARVKGSPSIFRIRFDFLTRDLNKTFGDAVVKRFFIAPRRKWREVSVEKGGFKLVLGREKSGPWQMKTPKGKFDGAALENFLEKMEDFKAHRFESIKKDKVEAGKPEALLKIVIEELKSADRPAGKNKNKKDKELKAVKRTITVDIRKGLDGTLYTVHPENGFAYSVDQGILDELISKAEDVPKKEKADEKGKKEDKKSAQKEKKK